ncbi:hypothetical protein [Streptosporangium sp. NPDC051022]|uniref:hypothetical protein n=1 Tax=Streptosporangium sp. NPDC051022 TaxID=3155752 RepID=UPI003425CFFE
MGSLHRSAVVQAGEKRRDVLRWYESRLSGPEAGRAWPEGAVVVVGRDLLPRVDDLAALGCRVTGETSPEGLRHGPVERWVPASARYVLVVAAREEFDIRLAGGVVDLGRRIGLPVGALPAGSAGELGFMLRRMALARRVREGRHVVVDAADSSSVVGDAKAFADPGARDLHSVSVYGHGNESHVKVGDRFICSHSASRFPEQDCGCVKHDLRLCRLDEIRCVWIHLGSCGALVPDWRRSTPATNFVDSFASSYAATVCGSLYRMPTSRQAIVGHELDQLDDSGPGGDDPSAGTVCLGDPILLKHTRGVLDRRATVAYLRGELKDIETGLARLSEDRERLPALTRTVEDAREKVNALRLVGGPGAREALEACASRIDGAAGWAARAATVLSAANERKVYGEAGRAEFSRCLGRMRDFAERFERELVPFVASARAIGARDVERAMKSGLIFGSTRSEVLCACRLCGLPVYVSTARGVANGRECCWARCDVCGHLARSPDGVRFPLITVPAAGHVGVRFFGCEPVEPVEPAETAEPVTRVAARVVVDVDDGVGGLHTRSVHEIAVGDEVCVRCDVSRAGPSVRVRALVVSGFAVGFARATVPSAELLGSPS